MSKISLKNILKKTFKKNTLKKSDSFKNSDGTSLILGAKLGEIKKSLPIEFR